MNKSRSSEKNWRKAMAIWVMLPICLSAGCGKRVSYVSNDHKLTKLKQGEAAPRDGVLVNEGYLSEMYEALGRPKTALPTPAAPAAASPNAVLLDKK